jgi:hypothetical protein
MSIENDVNARSKLVSCARHGEGKRQAFVCEHLLHGETQGFFFDQEEGPYPDAWCRACERLRVDNGGEWTEELTNKANIQLVCEDCYQEIKLRNIALVN